MAQETKVGLLIGLALILLVGLVLSDLFTGGSPESAEASSAATEFGREAQAGIYDEPDVTINSQSLRRNGFDRMPGFAAEPPQEYGTPSMSQPVESWSPPTTPTNPSPTPGTRTLPELTVEPPLPQLDTLEARDAAARFNDSLEAMRLAVKNPVEIAPNRDVLPTRVEQAQPMVASVPPALAPINSGAGGTTYIHYVQAGQTLSQIARQHYGNPEFAAAIAQTNPTKVDREGQVRAGARLEIPPLGSPVFSRLFQPVHEEHAVRIDSGIPALPGRPAGPTAEVSRSTLKEIEVQPGDTLSQLAAQHLGSSKLWGELLAANSDQMESAADLRSGMTLRVPQRATIAESARVAAPTRPAVAANPDNAVQSADTYTVQAGDNLTRIAERLMGDGERWDDLLAANSDQLDRPENLQAGMVLKLPTGYTTKAAPSAPTPTVTTTTLDVTAPPTKTYTVQAGDNLTRIAARKLGDGDRWRELFEANADQLSGPDDLFAGQTLRLP